jgi:DNA replicative helicase MCM subunit Mcm2 (Cdc46/Mcm family)
LVKKNIRSDVGIEEDPKDDLQNEHFSEEEKTEITAMHQQPQLYTKMAQSICPTVFGHIEIEIKNQKLLNLNFILSLSFR